MLDVGSIASAGDISADGFSGNTVFFNDGGGGGGKLLLVPKRQGRF